MDLGIAGRTAVICASSQGLGYACAHALAKEGVNIILNARGAIKLAQAVEALRDETGVDVQGVVADVTTKDGREALLDACRTPDILINNNAGPDPRQFQELDEDAWFAALAGNMVAPLQLTRAVLGSMRAKKFGRIINITSAMVTTPRPHMTLSAGSRAGLTAAMKGVSLDVARDNVTINNLLPERIDTARQEHMAHAAMAREGIDYEEARRRQVESIAAKRLGLPLEFGAVCAFLCSSQAGFVSGQNLHVDGGSYPALI